MAMRAKMTHIKAPDDAIDTCGTGGDASGTYNVSTAAGLVVAASGVKVAKHGNRALSSKAGSADVLTALGVNIETTPETVERCIAEVGIGFMMAPRHHGAMRHVGGTRVELGTRTIFNLLRPAVQSCRHQAAADRRVREGMDRDRWQKCSAASARSGPGSCMARTALTRSRRRPRPMSPS